VRDLRLIIASALALSASHLAHAVNIGFLRDAPITFFSQEEMGMFKQTVLRSLADNADGQTSRWSSTTSDSGGEVTPLDTRNVDDTTCRRTRIVNRAKGREGFGVYEFCLQPDGDWKIVSRAPN